MGSVTGYVPLALGVDAETPHPMFEDYTHAVIDDGSLRTLFRTLVPGALKLATDAASALSTYLFPMAYQQSFSLSANGQTPEA